MVAEYQGATYNNKGELVDQNGNPISRDEASAQTFPTVPPSVKSDVNSTDETLNAFAQNSSQNTNVTTNDDNTYGGVRHNAKGTGYVMDIDGVETPVDVNGNVLSQQEIEEVPESVIYDPEKDPLAIAAKKKEDEKLEDPDDKDDKTNLLKIATKNGADGTDIPEEQPAWMQKILDGLKGDGKGKDPDGEEGEEEPEGPDVKAMGQAFMKMGEDIKKPNYEWSGDDIF